VTWIKPSSIGKASSHTYFLTQQTRRNKHAT
jgi:hypothetical protein